MSKISPQILPERTLKMDPAALRKRLGIESDIIADQMPQFKLHQNNGKWYFKGWSPDAYDSERYHLTLGIPSHYPDQMPLLYVTYPRILSKFQNRGAVNDHENSHDFHTGSNGSEGCVQICHFNSDTWDASSTCVGVFMKGVLWWMAYEMHLLNGKTINENLIILKERQE